MFEQLSDYFKNSTVLIGICILFMNIGGGYVKKEIPDYMEEIFNTPLLRRFFVFTIVLLYTKDIESAIIVTIIFIIFVKFLLNKESIFCILPKEHTIKKKVSHEDYLRANKTIKDYLIQSSNYNN
tara:strand:- start:287 stop:661 length:375 start_codon:yes stop_codon:yes gene_type:complete